MSDYVFDSDEDIFDIEIEALDPDFDLVSCALCDLEFMSACKNCRKTPIINREESI